MALNFSIFDIPLPIFLSALVLILAVIVILTLVEVRVSKKALAKKEFEETYYQKKLAATAALVADPNSFLISLDKLAREFFSEELGFGAMGKYSQLIDGLKSRNLEREIYFCQRMQEALYSGERLDQAFMQKLIFEMKNFILRKEKRELVEASKPQVVPSQQIVQKTAEQNSLNENILKYLREGKKRGFEFTDLKKKLLGAGFDENEIDKVEKFMRSELERQRIPINTEKKILTNFLNPKKGDLEIIKRGVEEKDDIGKAEIIEIVPYKKEIIETKKTDYPSVEPPSYKKISNFDDLERIKKKADSRRKGVIAG